jgi:hypothetical protein
MLNDFDDVVDGIAKNDFWLRTRRRKNDVLEFTVHSAYGVRDSF